MTKEELRDYILRNKHALEIELIGKDIKELPPEIGEMNNLRSLILFDNKIKQLPQEFENLINLQKLNLSDNDLTTLPPQISKLVNLQELSLEANHIKSIPPTIGNLSNLKVLYLSLNQLTDLPLEIGDLKNLEEFYVRDNKLRVLPKTIGKLKNIRELYLWDNQLRTLPEEICELEKLSKLELKGNPLETPPLEIAVSGIRAIQHYFRQLDKEGEDKIYEAKLLIVGEPGAGKTSLAKKIINPQYELRESEDTTKGIEVYTWKFLSLEGRDFRVNLWDFGGQEIYHSTHQFFLTKRSLYALVADTRKEDTDFYYWLNVVELLSDNSPLLIILNERQDRHREIGERQLRGQFSNLKDTLTTNLADNRGLDRIIEEIKHQMTMLPHVGSTLPKTWVKVRQALENDPRNYIDLQEYLFLCQRNGFVKEKDKLQLSGYLHDIGICLHFLDDPILKRSVILKPEWGTTAVYKVLDNPQVIANMGHFYRTDLTEIWGGPEYIDHRDELLQLMIKFKLCYEIPSYPGSYIAPQLLSENQPDYPWNDIGNLFLRYTYEFMPKGILTQFIVTMHQWVAEQKLVWRSGVVLEKDETRAEVVENFGQRSIKIRVAGENKKDLLTIVMYELDRIHNAYSRLKYQKLIPCNCDHCKGSQDREFYSYKVLRKFISNRQESIQCHQSFQMVSVLSLIDDILDRKNLDKSEEYQYFKEEIIMGDKYIISGQAGAVGPGAHAHDLQFQQIWNQVQGKIDLAALAQDLEKIKKQLKEQAETPAEFQAVADVAAAAEAARQGDGPKALIFLKKAGKIVFDVAQHVPAIFTAEGIWKILEHVCR